jgi:hypothetical protein
MDLEDVRLNLLECQSAVSVIEKILAMPRKQQVLVAVIYGTGGRCETRSMPGSRGKLPVMYAI